MKEIGSYKTYKLDVIMWSVYFLRMMWPCRRQRSLKCVSLCNIEGNRAWLCYPWTAGGHGTKITILFINYSSEAANWRLIERPSVEKLTRAHKNGTKSESCSLQIDWTQMIVTDVIHCTNWIVKRWRFSVVSITANVCNITEDIFDSWNDFEIKIKRGRSK